MAAMDMDRHTPARMVTSPQTAGAGRPHLKPLTSLRFVAAILVVIHHFGMLAPAPVPRVFRPFLAGYLGVNFFFLLSGFILVYTYLDQQGQMRVSRYEFWVARFARIYPIYLVGLIVGAAPYFWEHHSTISRMVTGLAGVTLTQAWIPSAAGQWDGPSWSLSVEAFFYLLFPLIAISMASLRRHQLYLVFGMCWAACLVFGVIGPRGAYDSSWIWNTVLTYNPLVRLPEFVMGAALGRLFMLRMAHKRPSRASGIFTPERLALFAAVSSGAALLWAPRLSDQLVHVGLFDPLFALLIYSFACSQGRLAAFLSTPLMLLLGEASYGLYILHYPILLGVHRFLGHIRVAPLNSPVLCAAYVCFCIALSVISFHLVERPARRAIKEALSYRRMQGVLGKLAPIVQAGKQP